MNKRKNSKPTLKQYPLRMPEELFQKVEAEARRQRRSVNSQLLKIVDDSFQKAA